MTIRHLNCGVLHAPPHPPASCHCLLVERGGRALLVDTGIGLADIARPFERIGRPAIEAAGFQFDERLTAVRHVERLGLAADDVADIVLTHGDPDHTGGLADFPAANVHISTEEHAAITSGDPRYSPAQFDHGTRWRMRSAATERWFGLEARRLPLAVEVEALLIPLFGHTAGHCGVAVRDGARWLLHVGDAYYLRAELTDDEHPVSALAAMRAVDDSRRRTSLAELRHLAREHADEIAMFGYHDFTELPPEARDFSG